MPCKDANDQMTFAGSPSEVPEDTEAAVGEVTVDHLDAVTAALHVAGVAAEA